MPPPNAPDVPSYYDPNTGQWMPLAVGESGAYYNPLMAGGQNPYATQAGALYGEEAAAGQRLSAQNILSQIRSRDAQAAASMQSAQQAMRAAGLQADELKERIRQFDITTAEGKRQFDLDFGLDREKFELQRQQLQLQGAEAIINAPRGPADFFAYASRLPSVANAGGSALGNIFGQALQNISGESLASLQQGDVLSNSQLATDLVRASQGGAVSDATSTFLRRSLGVNVPGATQVAQQQAQQQAQAAVPPAMPGVPGAALVAPTGPTNPGGLGAGLGPGGMGLNLEMAGPQPGMLVGGPGQTFEQWLAQNGYDIPHWGQSERGAAEIQGYSRSSDPDIRDNPTYFGQSSGDIAKTTNFLPGIKPIKDMTQLQQQYWEAQRGNQYNLQQAQAAQAGGAGSYLGTGGAAAGGNPLYQALLAGGPSFMQRLGALGGQIPRGYGTSIQEWNRFEPTAQAMYTGLLSEAGLETPEDFLAGVVKAAPNFAPSRMTRMR